MFRRVLQMETLDFDENYKDQFAPKIKSSNGLNQM